MSGADADELEQLGHRMEAAADRLGAIRDEVTAVVRQAHWEGDDALDFRDQWQFRLTGLLQGASAATREAGQVAVRNAVQQRVVSGTDNAAVPGPITSGPHGPGNGGDIGAVRPWDPFVFDQMTWIEAGMGVVGISGAIGETTDWMRDSTKLAKFLDNGFIKGADGLFNNPAFKTANKWLGGIGVALDGVKLGNAIAGGDPTDIKAASFDVAFGATSLAVGLAFPPAGIALAVVGVGLEFVPDHTKAAMVDGVADAAQWTWHEAGKVVDADIEAVKDVGEAAASIVTGGFNTVRGWF
jgi:hypothetical protein